MSELGRFGVAVIISVMMSGCGGSAGEDYEVVPVSGKITVNGEPAEGISVAFFPVEGTPGTGGFATTDASGAYQLQTRQGRDGTAPGQYRVLFTQILMPDGSPVPKDEMATDVGAVNQLPEHFNDPYNTPIGATVEKDGDNGSHNFDLKVRR
ncbi:hypothetical protein [Thalassoroseus pseudoceratinae]|uniref:hypothetical protein n=1 Tax=Thalassoroseus pseudoceratinae TaxID=2713176 RepID=UPI00141ECDB0|nr:hypothetical protein [Thalassoroseus pseudoceratinae]